MIKTGSDFSGAGAFDQALMKLKIDYKTIFACDIDKYARQTYVENYGEPKYFPTDVYEREIPKESLDIYMTSPPCQAFSLAGKRKGEDDHRGILFYNSHEFIQTNKPRYFIFENVKGLLSDNKKDAKDNIGQTFQSWITLLGGKSVNGEGVLFPHENSVPYHIYWQVLNAKHYGVPQNRERVFIIGIRDDEDNHFRFPKKQHLTKRLKDVLEDNVDEKYFLSEKLLSGIIRYNKTKGEIANVNKGRQSGQVFSEDSDYITTLSACDYKMPKSIEIKSATKKDVWIADYRTDEGLRIRKDGNSPCMTASMKPNTESMKRGNCVPFVGFDEKIRRLTPRECFRLMDFPDTFKWTVSDTQAYKQAGNSIVVNVLAEILKKLKI